MPECDHSGSHSGEGRYSQPMGVMRYVVVCDACGQELREVLQVPYEPAYRPDPAPPPGRVR
jgi:hypothetical protein